MRPLKLTLNAFGPFVKRQEIDFTCLSDEEIFLVTGDTGAGKTTIFDGISFALYGLASGEARKPGTLKSDHAAPGELCWVGLEFSLHGRKYVLRRSPAQRGIKRDGSVREISPTAELALPDGETIVGNTAVTERVEQILGLKHRQFKQTTMLAQGEFLRLIEANGKEKEQIFSKIFATSLYADLTERLTCEEKALESRIKSAQESIARCIRELAGYGHEALSGEDALFLPYDRIESLVKDEVKRKLESSEQIEQEIASLEEKRSKLNPERAKEINTKLDRRDMLRRLNRELMEKQPPMLEAENRLNHLKSAIELSGQEEIILEGKKQAEEYEKKLKQLGGRLAELNTREQLLFSDLNVPTPEIQGLMKSLDEAKARYELVYRDFLDGQASILASELTAGGKCPVCGSTRHPEPAVRHEKLPDEQIVKDAGAVVEDIAKQIGDRREHQKNLYLKMKTDRDTCAALVESTKSHHDSITGQFNKHRAAFIEKLAASGFQGYRDYRSALEGKGEIPVLQQQTEDYKKDRVTAAAQLSELELDTKGHQREDVDLIISESAEISRKLDALMKSRAGLHSILESSEKRLLELSGLHEESMAVSRRYGIARELAALSRGSRTVSFERYVLTAYFDDIIRLANVHLQRMTGYRFRLCRRDDMGSGLDMEVIDSNTGKRRDVSTLSGGEGFKASLALALGLSGIVQIYSGGVSIDAMFIDEGFGSLDEKSLDAAVETLITLKKSGRMVGIISHVPQLRAYIDKKLAVNYSPDGSTVCWI